MKNASLTVAVICLISLAGLAHVTDAAQVVVSERQVKNLVKRIDRNTERFRQSIDRGLDRSQIDGSQAEDNINQFLKDFADATDRLEERADDNQATTVDAEAVLRRAVFIDNFMRRNSRHTNARAKSDWSLLRRDLDRLAGLYKTAVLWQ